MEKVEPRSLGQWIGEHRYSVGLTVVFIAIGAIVGPLAFPEVAQSRTVSGGALFGAFCAMCVVLPRMLDSPVEDDGY